MQIRVHFYKTHCSQTINIYHKISMNINSIHIKEIRDSIELLEARYWSLSESGDHKALSALERCIELRMRLLGIDGKKELECTEPGKPTSSTTKLDLTKLSETTLTEVLGAIKD